MIESGSYSVFVLQLFTLLMGQTMQPVGSFHVMGIAGVLQTRRHGSVFSSEGHSLGRGGGREGFLQKQHLSGSKDK